MGNIQFDEGKILFIEGEIAFNADCCCEGAPCGDCDTGTPTVTVSGYTFDGPCQFTVNDTFNLTWNGTLSRFEFIQSETPLNLDMLVVLRCGCAGGCDVATWQVQVFMHLGGFYQEVGDFRKINGSGDCDFTGSYDLFNFDEDGACEAASGNEAVVVS